MSDNYYHGLCKAVGETVTIYTSSGGESGSGFTGVVISVNECYCRLLTSFGSAPDCALGSECDHDCDYNDGEHMKNYKNNCHGSGTRLGSVVDIPMDKIVAFVHNAI